MISEKDRILVDRARGMRWEDVAGLCADNAAETMEGAYALSRLASSLRIRQEEREERLREEAMERRLGRDLSMYW